MPRLLVVLLLTAAFSGCLAQLTGDHYRRHEARVPQQVTYGKVAELRMVVIEGTKSRVGPAVGAIIGGVAGREVGDGRGRDLGRVAGATAGGVAGAAVEEVATRRQGIEITVHLRDGDTIAVVQQIDPKADFRVGDEVKVLFLNGDARVVPVAAAMTQR